MNIIIDSTIIKINIIDVHAKFALDSQPLIGVYPTQQKHDHFPLWHFLFMLRSKKLQNSIGQEQNFRRMEFTTQSWSKTWKNEMAIMETSLLRRISTIPMQENTILNLEKQYSSSMKSIFGCFGTQVSWTRTNVNPPLSVEDVKQTALGF